MSRPISQWDEPPNPVDCPYCGYEEAWIEPADDIMGVWESNCCGAYWQVGDGEWIPDYFGGKGPDVKITEVSIHHRSTK